MTALLAGPGRHQQQPVWASAASKTSAADCGPVSALIVRHQRRHRHAPTRRKFFNRRSTVSLFARLSVSSASAATTSRRSGTRRSSTRSARTASAARSTSRQLYDGHASGQLDRLLPAVEPRRLLRPSHGGRRRRRHARGDTSGAATSAVASASPRVRSTSPRSYAEPNTAFRQHRARRSAACTPAAGRAGYLERRRLLRLRFLQAAGLLQRRQVPERRRRRLPRSAP